MCSSRYYSSDTFSNALEYKANDGEHPVEFFEVYRDYLNRFEAKIEDFIREVVFEVLTIIIHISDGLLSTGFLCRM